MYDNMQVFFESTQGKIISAIVLIVIFILAIMPWNKEEKGRNNVKVMTISALLIALGMIMGQIKLFTMPQGGSVTLFSMLPIAICAYLLGTRQGVLAGMCLGILNLILGPYVIHPVQLLLDYPIAFGAMGIGGFLRNTNYGLVKTYIVGLLGRYLCAFLSGLIFFGCYAPEGFSAFTWSLWYNFTYLAAEGVITVIIISIPSIRKVFERIKTNLGTI